MPEPDLSALAEHAYAAALQDDLWRSWSERMIAGFGCQGGLFWVVDGDNSAVSRMYPLFADHAPEATTAEYMSGPVDTDPQLAKLAHAARSEIYTDLDHLDLDDPVTRAHLKWQEAWCLTRYHMTASVVLDERFRSGICLHRTRAAGPTPEARRRQLETLFPHFSRALQLSFRHQEMLQRAWWDGLQARDPRASILLDEYGGVQRLSAGAERILRCGDGLTLAGGRLGAREPDDAARLAEMIRLSVADRQPEAGSCTIGRGALQRPYRLAAYPLVRSHRFLAPFEAAALLHIVDPASPPRPLSPLQRQLFGLTEREAEVAERLLAGHSPESLAAELAISANTARVHLRALFRKTGTNRQPDLVRTLLTEL